MSNDMLKRVQTLQHYMRAMKDGDIETVAALLEDAEQDRALENMLLEVNAGYQYEDSTPVEKNDIIQAQQLMRTIAYHTTRGDTMQSPLIHAEDASAQTLTMVTTEQPKSADQVSPGRNALTPAFPARAVAKQKWYRPRKYWIAPLAAAILIFFVLLQSNGALASQLLSLFHYQPVPAKVIDKAVTHLVTTMNDLGDFAPSTEKAQPLQFNLTQAQAAHDIDFPLVLPQHLPQQVGNTPTFTVRHGGQGTFTFSTTKAHAYLTKIGYGNVLIPANLDGATFRLTMGSAVFATYGKSRIGTPYGPATFFVITETPRSEFQATGKASVQNLLNFMLSLPNVTHVAVAFLAQNNGTMPFSVPDGMQSQSMTVHNVAGLLLSNNTNAKVANTQVQLGNMLAWQENGINYNVTGDIDGYTMNVSQLLAAANSLH